MRLLADHEKPKPDTDDCPYCGAEITELADDVSDEHFRDDGIAYEDVVGIDCPACGERIALVREHFYCLKKFAKAEDKA